MLTLFSTWFDEGSNKTSGSGYLGNLSGASDKVSRVARSRGDINKTLKQETCNETKNNNINIISYLEGVKKWNRMKWALTVAVIFQLLVSFSFFLLFFVFFTDCGEDAL